MTIQDVLALNRIEKVATARMMLAIGEKMSYDESYKDLWNRYTQISEVQVVFNEISKKVNPDLKDIKRSAQYIKLKLGSFLKKINSTPAIYGLTFPAREGYKNIQTHRVIENGIGYESPIFWMEDRKWRDTLTWIEK
jgi:hypothetical protein